ncbi:DNA-binding MarR family transcriptional regulator [Lipingzhangella halophila]|uniref:DNA-binding MarR family transcriptional regulator n=1 Tax=Lipingzhangella halophila TaxID=1783352 RepID=A0A7W7RJ65_9ACTN|nr:transcriptional regulator [Lipingzhangella halophila]MBB4932957.1 DNA-binding MarR family transcriptional regulator [Lipingzhangella halophila]
MNPLPELNPVIHAQGRLRVMVTLQALPPGDQLAFSRLREILAMTSGNLSVHIRKLEDANYVESVKTHERRSPVTYFSLTSEGRRALEEYVRSVQALLSASAPDTAAADKPSEGAQ